MQEMRVQLLHWEDLEKETVTLPSILAWEIPWIEEPGRLLGVAWDSKNSRVRLKGPNSNNCPTYHFANSSPLKHIPTPDLVIWVKFTLQAIPSYLSKSWITWKFRELPWGFSRPTVNSIRLLLYPCTSFDEHSGGTLSFCLLCLSLATSCLKYSC